MSAIGNAADNPQLKTDLSVVNKYTDNSLLNKTKRCSQFILEHPDVQFNIVMDTVSGGTLGAILGAGCFGIPALVVAPPSAPAAAKVGAILGGIYGAYRVNKEHVMRIKRSNRYEDWKSGAIKTQVYPIFQKYVADEVSDIYKCLYTSSLVVRPVRDQHGHLFEHTSVLEDLRMHGGRIRCPRTLDHEITENQLVYDPTYHPTMMTALTPQFSNTVNNAAAVAGVQALLENARQERLAMYNKELEPINLQLLGCKTEDERAEVLKTQSSMSRTLAKKYQL